MPSHLSDIGFATLPRDQDDMVELLDRVRREGQRVAGSGGTYYRWSPGAGVELWGQVDSNGDGIGLVPHFEGATRMTLGLASAVRRDGDTPLDGSVYAWAEPTDGGDSGLFPVVFDQPDSATLELRFPAIVDVQLVAFAREQLRLYPTEEAYAGPQSGLKMAIESFIPVGTFKPDGTAIDPPDAFAFFTGRILAAETRRNPVTGDEFHWMHVRTLGGEVDVVADPALVPVRPLRGGVVQGVFWLSGRVSG